MLTLRGWVVGRLEWLSLSMEHPDVRVLFLFDRIDPSGIGDKAGFHGACRIDWILLRRGRSGSLLPATSYARQPGSGKLGMLGLSSVQL